MAGARNLVKNPTNHHTRVLVASLKRGTATAPLAHRVMPLVLDIVTRHQQMIDYFAYPASQRGYRCVLGNSVIEVRTESQIPTLITLSYSDRENFTEGRSPSAISAVHISALVSEICRLAPKLFVCDDSLEDLDLRTSITFPPLAVSSPKSGILTFPRRFTPCSSSTPHASP